MLSKVGRFFYLRDEIGPGVRAMAELHSHPVALLRNELSGCHEQPRLKHVLRQNIKVEDAAFLRLPS